MRNTRYYVTFGVIAFMLFIFLSGAVVGDFNKGEFWSILDNSLVQTNTSQNVVVNANSSEYDEYDLYINGTTGQSDNATFYKKLIIENSNIDIGNDNYVNGFQSIILGMDNFDEGFKNSIYGFNNIIYGDYGTSYAVVIGSQNIIGQDDNSDGSVIIGEANIVNGVENTVFGSSNSIIGNKNAIVGSGNTFKGNNTFYTDKHTIVNNSFQANDYYSRNNSKGITNTFIDNKGNTYTIEDGLIVDVVPFFCKFLIHMQIPTNRSASSNFTNDLLDNSFCLGVNVTFNYYENSSKYKSINCLSVYNSTLSNISNNTIYFDISIIDIIPDDTYNLTFNVLGFESGYIDNVTHSTQTEIYLDWWRGKTIWSYDGDFDTYINAGDIDPFIYHITNSSPNNN